MKIFKLPDLGEGLPDAIIRQWHVNVGDAVKKDQPIVAMETAKALVDVVAPFDTTIEKLFGNVDETIETGKPLIGFEGESDIEEKKDTGTVVGKIEQSNKTLSHTHLSTTVADHAIKATPAVRALARKFNIDLSTVEFSGDRITAEDVENALAQKSSRKIEDKDGWESLSGVKRAMVLSMQQSHHDIVPVTIIDEVDIHAWKTCQKPSVSAGAIAVSAASTKKQDITVRIIRAMIDACKAEPALNAHFDGKTTRIKKYKEMNLGLAVDMPHGLFVPVIKDITTLSDEQIREKIERFKKQAETKSIAQSDLHGATIVLSNFGTIAGRYATPIILPPTIAIIGVGRIIKKLELDENNKSEYHRVIPLSLTVDHRAITGGEAARFLKAMMDSLRNSHE